jgi:hypothetical protein
VKVAMMTRQMLSTVSSGRMPRCRSTRSRIIEASRAGRNAEPVSFDFLTEISVSMMPERSISNSCIARSMRSISARSSPSVGTAPASFLGLGVLTMAGATLVRIGP